MTIPTKITTDLTALQNAVSALHTPKLSGAQLTTLKTALATLKVDLPAAFDDIQARLDAANQTIATDAQKLASVQAALGLANTALETAKTQILSLQETVAADELKIAFLQTAITSATVSLDAAESRIRQLEHDLMACLNQTPVPDPTPVPTPTPTPTPAPTPTGAWDEMQVFTFQFMGQPWGKTEQGEMGSPNLGHWGAFKDADGVPFGPKPYAVYPPFYTSHTPIVVEIDITTLAKEWQANGNKGLMLWSHGGELQMFSRNRAEQSLRPYLLIVGNPTTTIAECIADVSLDCRSPYAPLGAETDLHVSSADYRVAMQFQPIVGAFDKVLLVLTAHNTDVALDILVFLLYPPTGGNVPGTDPVPTPTPIPDPVPTPTPDPTPVPTPTPTPVMGGSVITVSTPSFPQWAQGMKHVTPCFRPSNGRIYFHGGDFRGIDAKYEQSYNQEDWSCDLALVLAAKTQDELNAAFRLEYPYEGFGGTTVQPKHTDFCAWVLDKNDAGEEFFWHVPGTMVPSPQLAPGETYAPVSDPNFIFGSVMKFYPDRPMKDRYEDTKIGWGPNVSDTWMCINYGGDLWRPGYNGGSGSVIDRLNKATGTWSTMNLFNGTLKINKEYLAHDVANSKFYAVDGINSRVWCVSLITGEVEDLGPKPGQELVIENYSYTVFNSNHGLLEYLNIADQTIYVADAKVRPLIWKVGATGINGRMGIYDPENDYSLWAGGVDPGNPTMTIFRPTVLPAWVPAPGFVTEVPTSNTFGSTLYATPAGPGSGTGNDYFNNWCSAAYCKDDGPLGSIALSVGGDADLWDTAVRKLILDAVCRWERCNERAQPLTGNTAPGGDPNFDEVWGEHKSTDGTLQPAVPHSYDQLGYVSKEEGCGPKGSFAHLTRTICYRVRGFRHPHLFDLDAKQWKRGSTAPDIIKWETSNDSPTWCFDTKRKRHWGIIGSGGPVQITALHYQDFVGGLSTPGMVSIPASMSLSGYPVSEYWPEGDSMVVLGTENNGGVFSTAMRVAKLSDASGFVPVTLTGDAIPAAQGYGFAYLNGKFYVRLASGARQNVWEITPGTWVVKMLTMQGVTVAPKGNANGMWKRFASVGPMVMWTDDIQGPTYAFTPPQS